jgi:hypothetical protein
MFPDKDAGRRAFGCSDEENILPQFPAAESADDSRAAAGFRVAMKQTAIHPFL